VGVLVIAALCVTIAKTAHGVIHAGVWGLLPLLLAFSTVPTLVTMVLWLDRFEPEPPWMLVRLFLWGAGAAYAVAVFVNPFVAGRLGLGWDATGVYFAPALEECLKCAGIAWLLLRRRDRIDGPLDGVVYALMIGLGFAVVENTQYYLNSLHLYGIGRVFHTWALRGLVTPFLHPFFTMAFGLAAGYVAVSRPGRVRGAAILAGGLLTSMVVHGTWNRFALTLYPTVFLPAFSLTVWYVVLAVRRQGQMLRWHLEPEVEAGLLRRQDLYAVLATHGGLRAAIADLDGESTPGAQSASYRSAAYALASHRERLARARQAGVEPDPGTMARDAELRARLWALRGDTDAGADLPPAPAFVRGMEPADAVAQAA
jgi:RsiW-degrading membrane proteinase PrsW (M82 family)